ncbi:MAG: hypothetical protein HeimC3_35610 [Candidatus Heimdallarchaeota archaeon LC_3]|nr:MAG: hypothetical protein HeimC3_35610 [Candidatus Heimdallarchaeota archaeon LC_3]
MTQFDIDLQLFITYTYLRIALTIIFFLALVLVLFSQKIFYNRSITNAFNRGSSFYHYHLQGMLKIQFTQFFIIFWLSAIITIILYVFGKMLLSFQFSLLFFEFISFLFSFLVIKAVYSIFVSKLFKSFFVVTEKAIYFSIFESTAIIPISAIKKITRDVDNGILKLYVKFHIIGRIFLTHKFSFVVNNQNDFNLLVTQLSKVYRLEIENLFLNSSNFKYLSPKIYSEGLFQFDSLKQRLNPSFFEYFESKEKSTSTRKSSIPITEINYVLLISVIYGSLSIWYLGIIHWIVNSFQSVFFDLYLTYPELQLIPSAIIGITENFLYYITTLIIIGVIYWFFLRHSSKPKDSLFNRLVFPYPRRITYKKVLLFSFVGFLISMGFFIVCYFFYKEIIFKMLSIHTSSGLLDYPFTLEFPSIAILSLLISGIISPIFQELLFRGFILRASEHQNWDRKKIYSFQIIIFTLYHLTSYLNPNIFSSVTHLTFLFLFTFIITWLVRYTGSILSACLLHIFYNSFWSLGEIIYSFWSLSLSIDYLYIVGSISLLTFVLFFLFLLRKLIKFGRKSYKISFPAFTSSRSINIGEIPLAALIFLQFPITSFLLFIFGGLVVQITYLFILISSGFVIIFSLKFKYKKDDLILQTAGN